MITFLIHHLHINSNTSCLSEADRKVYIAALIRAAYSRVGGGGDTNSRIYGMCEIKEHQSQMSLSVSCSRQHSRKKTVSLSIDWRNTSES